MLDVSVILVPFVAILDLWFNIVSSKKLLRLICFSSFDLVGNHVEKSRDLSTTTSICSDFVVGAFPFLCFTCSIKS